MNGMIDLQSLLGNKMISRGINVPPLRGFPQQRTPPITTGFPGQMQRGMQTGFPLRGIPSTPMAGFPTQGLPDIAELLRKPTTMGGDIEEQVIKQFGTTKNPLESLYITTKGEYLGNKGFEGGAEHKDFSRAITGQDRETAQFPLQTGMLEIVDNGEELDVRVFKKPTQAQLDKIMEVSKKRKDIFIDDYVENYKTGTVDASIPSDSYGKENLHEFIAKYSKPFTSKEKSHYDTNWPK